MTRISIHLSLAVVAAVVLAACGGESVSLDGKGEACLSPDGSWPEGGQSFEADAPLYVTVRFHECLSSSCDTQRRAECTVEVEGDSITIVGRASYTDESGVGSACTTDCGLLEASCSLDSLQAGEYTVTYGGESIELTVPTVTGVTCIDAGH